MYYNDSTFPIFLYQMRNPFNSFDELKNNLIQFRKFGNFENDFLHNIRVKEKQDLFGFLVIYLPHLIYSNHRIFRRDELTFKESLNDDLFELCNLRIDVDTIYHYLIDLDSEELIEKCNYENVISEIHLYLLKYIFIKLSKSFYTFEFKGKKRVFDIIENSKKYYKYSKNDFSKLSLEKAVIQDNFIKAYLKSFENENNFDREALEKDLIYMSNRVNQKKKLNNIFTDNIYFSSKAKKSYQNNILIYFFKNVTCKLFYKQLNDYDIDYYEVIETFRTFRKRL